MGFPMKDTSKPGSNVEATGFSPPPPFPGEGSLDNKSSKFQE